MTQPAVPGSRNNMIISFIPETTVVEAQELVSEHSVSPRGSGFQSEPERIKHRQMEIQTSWRTKGCSVLVDGWRDVKGRDLINVVVDCPRGPIYLKSLDISAAIDDYDALLLVFGEIVEEVGANNVVQIISNYTSPDMKKVVGKLFMVKYPSIYWTVSSSHCLELMLEKMGTMDFIKGILNQTKTLTKYIYSRTAVLNLMRSFTSSNDLVRSTKIRSIMPFLTLESVVSEKQNLERMFNSSVWSSSVMASRTGGRRIADLVGDASFWSGAIVVLKATIPLVSALRLIHESAVPQLGFIYEIMDQVKETIKKDFDEKEAQYMPYWKAIDELWEDCLHSPLHSAAYYLNPLFRYSKDFCADVEVLTDLHCCISHMVEEKKVTSLVIRQLGFYAKGLGPFRRVDSIQQSSSISAVQWWLCYGKECPELQSLAIRILSQTCDGASKYHLDRGRAEKVLTEERDEIEQQQLKDLTYLHYNSQLEDFVPDPSNHYCEIDPMDDWIVDETLEKGFLNGEPIRMEPVGGSSRENTKARKGTSRSTRRKLTSFHWVFPSPAARD